MELIFESDFLSKEHVKTFIYLNTKFTLNVINNIKRSTELL